MKKLLLYLTFIALAVPVKAQYIKGSISDEAGKPLPFANIYVKNTTYGAVSNSYGKYFLPLKPMRYTLVYSFIGYQNVEKEIVVSNDSPLILNVSLKQEASTLDEVEIVAGKKDRARQIIDSARAKRKFYFEKTENYQCKTYVITSLEKEPVHQPDSTSKKAMDTLDLEDLKDIAEMYKKQKTNLIEFISTNYYKKPGKYKEIVEAHHDYMERKAHFDKNVSMSLSYGEDPITPEPRMSPNPNIIYTSLAACDFSFYQNQISIPSLCQQPLLSPLAATAPLSYKYALEGSFYEDEKLIYRIRVIPLFKSEALFEGTLFIEDGRWELLSVDLSINPASLNFCKDFHVIQNYEEVGKNIWLPVRREFNYTIRDDKYYILGNTRIDHSQYLVNQELPSNFFNNELERYKPEAFDRDSTYWQTARPIVLKENEMQFIQRTDSIADYFTSDEYYRKLDSAFNRVTWWLPLTGYGHRNRKAGYEFYIEGILNQINPVGIGGYRHKLPGYFKYTFKNNMELTTRGFIDFGFRNRDVKGKLGFDFMYLPMRFGSTFIEAGHFYEMINNYASLERLFSRSNYVQTTSFRIRQKMELVNGLYGELTFDYSDQDPLTDIKFAPWSKWLFGEMNTATDFKRYIKSETQLRLLYRINQKYLVKGNKKIIIGAEYPELSFRYRKGIPGLFGSEVNFDYIELGARNETQLGRLGSSRWQVNAGRFLNTANLRLLEYKFFRGSDRYLFSDPLQSYQLYDPDSIVYTNNAFFMANYIHHFEGTILGKQPLNRWLKLQLAAGGGFLSITNAGVTKTHTELFAGLERVWNIKGELFRFGLYAVGRDNVFESGNLTFKFGIDFFESYSNKWHY